MMVVLCGQRVQAVHDHGGRRIGKTSRGPAYHRTSRACSAGTHYTSDVLVTRRREGEPVSRRLGRGCPPKHAPGGWQDARSRILAALPTRITAAQKLVARRMCLLL